MIFEFTSYRKYLLNRLGQTGTRNGRRKQLAQKIAVHTTFLSQVLTEKAQLSLEQGEAVNQFFGHTEEESDYFINLILMERAGSVGLRRRLKRKIDMLREERLNISNRLEVNASISEADRERFYSTYLYGALHVLSSIEKYQSPQALAGALKISLPKAKDLLEFLFKIGLLVERDGRILPTSSHIHLGSKKEIILKHHTNWRLHSINRLGLIEPNDVHYSACMSLSHDDAFKIKDSLLENLKKNLKIVEGSKEQTAYVYSIDFYPLVEE